MLILRNQNRLLVGLLLLVILLLAGAATAWYRYQTLPSKPPAGAVLVYAARAAGA